VVPVELPRCGSPHGRVPPLSVLAPRFSVIVPTRGDDRRLFALLEALERQSLAAHLREWIVVFDGTSPSREAARRLGALEARGIVLGERRGPGAARNAGAAVARGQWLAFTEDDCIPAPTWLEEAARAIDRDDAEVIEGSTLVPSGVPVRRSEMGVPTFLPTNLFVTRGAFDEVGGYCEKFFDRDRGIYFREDSDFGFSLEGAGKRVRVEPTIRVTHPVEHPRFLDPLRWARRYRMDALLERRHPGRFRERIEVTQLGPFRLRRVVLRASLGYVIALVAALAAWLLDERPLAFLLLGLGALMLLPIAAKWRFHPARLPLVPIVPIVLVAAYMGGALHFSSSER